MKKRIKLWAGALGVAIIMTVTPTVANADEYFYGQPMKADCAFDATSAVVEFDVANGEVFWSIQQDGTALAFGEANGAKQERYVQVVSVTPNVPFTVYVDDTDGVETDTFTCSVETRTPHPDDISPVAELKYEPTTQPYIGLGWFVRLFALLPI